MTISSKDTGNEADKLPYDYFKHLTTLNTGSILIIITFLQSSVNSTDSNLLSVSLIAFIISLTSSTYLMYVIAMTSEKKLWQFPFKIVIIISWFTFLFGIVSLFHSVDF